MALIDLQSTDDSLVEAPVLCTFFEGLDDPEALRDLNRIELVRKSVCTTFIVELILEEFSFLT